MVAIWNASLGNGVKVEGNTIYFILLTKKGAHKPWVHLIPWAQTNQVTPKEKKSLQKVNRKVWCLCCLNKNNSSNNNDQLFSRHSPRNKSLQFQFEIMFTEVQSVPWLVIASPDSISTGALSSEPRVLLRHRRLKAQGQRVHIIDWLIWCLSDQWVVRHECLPIVFSAPEVSYLRQHGANA